MKNEVMEEFKSQVKDAFKACRGDIDSLKVQNELLIQKLQLLSSENTLLKQSFSQLTSQVQELTSELKTASMAFSVVKEVKPQPEQYESHLELARSEKKDPYQALLEYKAKKNKREVLKQKMLQMIGERGIQLSELKFMFVDHFGYCSKASFYNYLKELEMEKTVTMGREQSKNLIFLTNPLSREV